MREVTVSSRGVYRKQPGALAVNCSRASRWGNPFVAGQDGTLAEVVAKYEVWLPTTTLVRQLAAHVERRRVKAGLPADAPVVLLCGSAHQPLCHVNTLAEALMACDRKRRGE